MPTSNRSAPRSSRESLSPQQRQVLDCLSEGATREEVALRTGLDPARVEHAMEDLRALRLLDERDAPSLAPGAASDGSSQLPPGVKPWPSETDDSSEPDTAPSSPPRSSAPPRSVAPDGYERNHKQHYERHFRGLDPEERAEAARYAQDNDLFALCLDPDPAVMAALLDNMHFGLDHARLVALHHRDPRGLEILARRRQWLRDSHVQRRLMRNPGLPEVVLERLLAGRSPLFIYRLTTDRDLPERNRSRARSRLKTSFLRAEPPEKAALVLKTEGRCLLALSGCTFDGRTTQLLTAHAFVSTLLVRNLARFPATPPPVLARLMKSGPVKRQPQLRALVQRHPNLGGDWKA